MLYSENGFMTAKLRVHFNKYLVLLRYIFNLALMQVDNKRQRFLTGARKREVFDARWEYIDWQRRLWKIPKTKADKAVSNPQAITATSSLILKLINLLVLFTTPGIMPASRQASMIQRYAHLAHETLLDACNVAGGLIGKLNKC